MTDQRKVRRERIVFLLDHLGDCLGPGGGLAATNAGSTDSIGFALTSTMADHPSVKELLRCLAVVEARFPRHYSHLWAYFGSGWMVEWVPKRRAGKTLTRVDDFGRRVPVREPRRVRALPGWLRAEPVDRETGEPRLVSRSVDVLAGLFRGEVFVPDQLREAAGLEPKAA